MRAFARILCMKRYFLQTIKILFTTGLIFALTQPVSAQVAIISKEDLRFDADSFEFEQANYNIPDSIYITPIFLRTDEYIADSDWVEGLFYYQAARLNQGDFLFHYLVTQEGRVYQGNSNGDDLRFAIEGSDEKPIIIGYLAGYNTEIDFSSAARAQLQELILEIANRNAIPLESVQSKSLELLAKTDGAIVNKVEDLGGRWKLSTADMINTIKPRYKPLIKTYNLKIESVTVPSGQVKYGDNVVITIEIQNTSDFYLYQGTDNEILISKLEGNSSKFYVPDVWLSLTQAPLMSEGQILKPKEKAKLQLRVNVPLYFGNQTESFQLINALGQPYPGTQFDVTLDIARIAQEVIEIKSTPTGSLNLRAAPGSNTVLTRVVPGQRFIVLERSAGWVKIDADGLQGWVSQQYTQVV